MARACASGALYHCTCASKPDEIPNNNFQWGGCPDNIRWGVYFAKRFIDNVEKNNANKTAKKKRNNDENRLKKTEVAVVNLHNNRVGRKVIIAFLSYVTARLSLIVIVLLVFTISSTHLFISINIFICFSVWLLDMLHY